MTTYYPSAGRIMAAGKTRTEWISAKQKPARPGVYECLYDNSYDNLPSMVCYRRWTGKKWVNDKNIICLFGRGKNGSGDLWRGLARREDSRG